MRYVNIEWKGVMTMTTRGRTGCHLEDAALLQGVPGVALGQGLGDGGHGGQVAAHLGMRPVQRMESKKLGAVETKKKGQQ